jgi:hypothetical protein
MGIRPIFHLTNTNALDIFTLIRIAPHPIPLPSRGEGWVRGPHVKKLNAFVLILQYPSLQ